MALCCQVSHASSSQSCAQMYLLADELPHRMDNATPGSFERRWITLISAGWLPHCIGPSRGCLVLKSGIIP